MILMMSLLVSCTLFPEEEVPLAPPLIPREEIAIKTMIVERGDIADDMSISGNVTPVRQYNLYLDVDSAILREHCIGSQIRTADKVERTRQIIRQDLRVQAGDILAVFTNEDIEAQEAPLQRAVELARINYSAAMRAWEDANTYYAELEGRFEHDRQNAEDAYVAAQIRHQHGDISTIELGQAETDYKNTIWHLEENLRAAKSSAEHDDDVHREKINIEAAEDNLQALKKQLEKLVIRAPIDGIITFYTDFFIGDTYRLDQQLFTIADDSSLYITVTLHYTQMMQNPFKAGAEVQILTWADYKEVKFAGRVISASSDQARAALLNEDAVMIEVLEWPAHVGLDTIGIRVNVAQDVRYNVVVVPLSAVQMTGSYSYVRVVEDGVSRERPVELGLRSLREVEIVSGLEPGEEIMIR